MCDSEPRCSGIQLKEIKSKDADYSESIHQPSTSKCSPEAIKTNKRPSNYGVEEIDDDFLSTEPGSASQNCDNKQTNWKTELSLGELQQSIKRKQLILKQLYEKLSKGDKDDEDDDEDSTNSSTSEESS